MGVLALGYVGVDAKDFAPWCAANDVRRSAIKSGLGAPLQVTRGQYNEVE